MRLWVGTVLVIIRVAVLHEEHEENNSADQRNKGDQQPQSAATRVVEPASGYRNGGKEHR